MTSPRPRPVGRCGPASRVSHAVFFNTSGISGQSQKHQHMQIVPGAVPLPPVEPAPWTVCSLEDGTRVRPAEGLPFYALLVEGRPRAVADLTVCLDEILKSLGLGANVLVFRSTRPGLADGVEVMVVPRSRARAESVDAGVGGLELLTGEVTVGPGFQGALTPEDRDRAFREVTLDDAAFTHLVAVLRSLVGLHEPAVAVVIDADS